MCTDIDDCTATTAHSSSEQSPRTRPDVFQTGRLARSRRSDAGEQPTGDEKAYVRRPRPLHPPSPTRGIRRRCPCTVVVSYARLPCRVVSSTSQYLRPFSVPRFPSERFVYALSHTRTRTRVRVARPFLYSSLPFVSRSPPLSCLLRFSRFSRLSPTRKQTPLSDAQTNASFRRANKRLVPNDVTSKSDD